MSGKQQSQPRMTRISRMASALATALMFALWLLPSPARAALFTNNARIEITDTNGILSRNPANGALTVMCWFKLSIPSGVTISSDMVILANQAGSTTTNDTHGYNIYFNAASGTVDFTAKGTSGLYRRPLISTPFIDRWYHVAVAIPAGSSGNYEAYVDGKAVTTAGEGSAGVTSVTNGVSIGGWGTTRGLWGEVQEVAVYQMYLTGPNVASRMFKDLQNPLYTNNLVGYYKLAASTNLANRLKNLAPGAAVGTDSVIQPNADFVGFEETDLAGEQSLYDSRKNGGRDAIAPLSGASTWSQTILARPTPVSR